GHWPTLGNVAFPLSLNLVRRQQQARLGIRNPLGKPDALQRLIEGLEAFHAEFDNDVPTAIGGVQRLNFWDAPQRFEHGGRVFAFDCHHGYGANALRFRFWFEPHGKTANDAVRGQSVYAVLNCTARYLQSMGQGCHRQAGIVAKTRNKPPISVVHRILYNMLKYHDDLSYLWLILSIMLAFLWQPAASVSVCVAPEILGGNPLCLRNLCCC